MFDTVWNLAITLNRSIPKLKSINSSLDNMLVQNHEQLLTLRKLAHSVEFEGITVSLVILLS